ncbi:uncharacterized protein LOC100897189 [Galendromus occidentalis]|uniref:Uncharacterized protein LOC100897189 n=1 Tax=Galendromus occidentalis TaxID=34638 RepID=A0AAJ6QQU1_9ACAR|nr:uncharacterized protein LOC100897189 [Galendromus occidentalis]
MEFRLGSMWDSQCLMLLFWSLSVVYSVGGHLNHDGESSIRHSTGGSSPHADGSGPAYSSIELTQIPHWSGNFAVSNATREIYLPAGKTVEDTAPMKLLHEKYFQGAPAPGLKFPTNGIVEYMRLGQGIRSLEFRKLEPGMFHFEYEILGQGKDTSGRWTVYAVPSYRVRRDSFFRQEIELPKFNFEDEVLIKSTMENIGVEVRPHRRSLAVFGLAGLSGNSITLSIQLTSSAPRKVYRLIIRLLVEEHQEPVGEVENIQFWAKDLGTLGSRVKLAECVAKGYGKGLPDLVHAKFEERGKGVTSFTSQLFKVAATPTAERNLFVRH